MPGLLFSYRGRIGVGQFWLGLLGGLASTVVLSIAVGILITAGLILSGAGPETAEHVTLGAGIAIAAYAVFTQLAVTAKRCQDSGRSGWWCLMALVPFVGLLWVVVELGLPASIKSTATRFVAAAPLWRKLLS